MRVPVLSKVRCFTRERRSSASPSRTKNPWRVAFPIAAMIAVGVASTRAQGQNTTRMVTERMICPVKSQVSTAALKAIITIHVAHRSCNSNNFCFSGVSRLYQADHALDRAVFANLSSLHFKGTKLVHCTGRNFISNSLVYRKRLTGHNSLVYRCIS